MRLEEELYIAQAAEAELAGTLSQAQRAELDARVAADPAFAQAYKEYYHTISSLQDGGRRARYKVMLQDVHQEMMTKKGGMKRLIIHFNPKHLRTAAMAACVALITSGITVWSLRHKVEQRVDSKNELLVHEIKNIKATQQKQESDIRTLKENTETVTPQPPQQSNYTGTGFALSNDGYLITNYHVVEGAQNVQVLTRDGKSLSASVIAYEPKNDIALLKVDEKNFRFGKGELPYSFMPGKAALGASIYTLGFPQDEIVYNEGYIASRNGYEGDSNQYRLEVPAGPGQSGAPVVDDDGNIIGIIRSKDAETESTTFAVTSKTLLRLLKDVPKDKRPRLPMGNRLAGLDRQQQIEKLQDYTFMVQVYKQ
jgi:S1-C subfamily serine protease